MKRLLVVLSLAVLPAAESPAATLLVDPGASRILVFTDKGGLFGFAGHKHVIRADEYAGSIEWTEKAALAVELTIVAASMKVADEDLEEEKIVQVQAEMESKVLEIEKYPEITFRSSRVARLDDDRFKVEGELELHGTGREVEFPATIVSQDGRVHLEAEIELKQKDYGIDPVSVGLGAVKVKNEVKLTFSLVYVDEAVGTR